MPDYEHILSERRGDVLAITLNRPDRLNAAPPAMFDEIGAALANLDGARAVLLNGAGRGFCSGADVAGSALGAANPGEATFLALTEHYNLLMETLAELPVPVVSAVRGPGEARSTMDPDRGPRRSEAAHRNGGRAVRTRCAARPARRPGVSARRVSRGSTGRPRGCRDGRTGPSSCRVPYG